MITGLHHIAVLVRDLSRAAHYYEDLLGRRPRLVEGAQADEAVFTLANAQLRLSSPRKEGRSGDDILERDGEGIWELGFAVGDIAAAHRRLDRLGLDPEPDPIVSHKILASPTKTHGVRLSFQPQDEPEPATSAPSKDSVYGLDHVVVRTADPERAAALYGARLGLDMALDRTNPDWGSRLMFFRCADMIVEIAHPLNPGSDKGPDKTWGLSWRVSDAHASRARLAALSFDVSPVRAGRKPGTWVFTVRDGTSNVPTLMLQPAPGRA